MKGRSFWHGLRYIGWWKSDGILAHGTNGPPATRRATGTRHLRIDRANREGEVQTLSPMRIEIELFTTAESAMEDKPLRVRCEYDSVKVLDAFTGRPGIESAADFLRRPYLERYKIIRDGRAQFLKGGEVISIDGVLAEARSQFAGAAQPKVANGA